MICRYWSTNSYCSDIVHIKVINNHQVVNNEFNINAVKVVKTTAGDHLYIRWVLISLVKIDLVRIDLELG